LNVEEGLPRWAGGAVCDGTNSHTTSCDQAHNSRTRVMPAVSALQADTMAVAGALPMCSAPVESTTTEHEEVRARERPYGPGADGAIGRERRRRSMNSEGPEEHGQTITQSRAQNAQKRQKWITGSTRTNYGHGHTCTCSDYHNACLDTCLDTPL
jgi:hypothetical protein